MVEWNEQTPMRKAKDNLLRAMQKGKVVTFGNDSTDKKSTAKPIEFDKNGKRITQSKQTTSMKLTKKELRTIQLKQRIPNMLAIAKREYGQSYHPRTHQVFIGYGKTVSRDDNKAGIVTQHKQKKYQIESSSPVGWSKRGVQKRCVGAVIELSDKKIKTKRLIFKRVPQKRTSSKQYPMGKSNHTNPKNFCITDTIRRNKAIKRQKALEKHLKERVNQI